jgi:hypothetical protein
LALLVVVRLLLVLALAWPPVQAGRSDLAGGHQAPGRVAAGWQHGSGDTAVLATRTGAARIWASRADERAGGLLLAVAVALAARLGAARPAAPPPVARAVRRRRQPLRRWRSPRAPPALQPM